MSAWSERWAWEGEKLAARSTVFRIDCEYSPASVPVDRTEEGMLATGSGTPKTVALETMHVFDTDLNVL